MSLRYVAALSALLHFAVVLGLFFVFLVAVGGFPTHAIAAIIPLILLVVAFGTGLGVLLGTVNVFYRDVEQSTTMVLQFWFWLTPIVYPARAVPDMFAQVLAWNPMWPIVRFAQTLLLEDRVPDWSTLAYPAVVALVLLTLGWIAFRKLSGEIVDEL